jgi:HEAT repeat protein
MVDVDFTAHKKFVEPERLNKILVQLEDKYAKTRTSAARELGSILNPEAVPALERAIKDDVKEVWSASLRSLAEIGSKSAVSALITALEDPRPEVRAEAARHLGMIRAFRAAKPIEGALRNETDTHAKLEMIEALGRLQESSALTLLASFLTDRNSSIRWSATWAIGMIGRTTRDKRAIEMLRLLEKHRDRKVQHEAVTALRLIGSKQV